MKRFIEGLDRGQGTLFPECLEDWIDEDNAVRVIDVFVDELDLGGLGFGRAEPEATGRPGYHPSVLLKLYIYGYLNRVQSSRRLEREAGRLGLFAAAAVAVDGSKFKPSTTGTGTSRGPRCNGVWSRSRRASRAISISWTAPTGRSRNPVNPAPGT